MKRKDVDSSMLVSIGYDEKKKILEVEFTSGGIYEYYDVDKKTYDELMNADSHGSYFYHNIRDDYDFSQIGKRKRSQKY
ncbi:MAG TPA: KTSC domain-containing protein [Pyrinomonadaceae bacterium]|nr:KTSC domain-containing protein [Pyrinomonadaceae bacterium]